MSKIELGYDYEKHRTSMRYWLLGKGYHEAHKAMELGLRHHTGVRKNGNPEFSHQVFQAQYARTLTDLLIFPEETLSVIFLHDIVEDCGFPAAQLHTDFGHMVACGVELMTDVDAHGREKPLDAYYGMMVECPLASICKPIDRIHNFQSMLGVFDEEKQDRYIQETVDHLLPMLKAARKRYTRQEAAYQNAKHVLLTLIHTIQSTRP